VTRSIQNSSDISFVQENSFTPNTNIFSTPCTNEMSKGSLEKHFLPKAKLIKLLQCMDFQGIYYPSEVMSNWSEDASCLLQIVSEELGSAHINNVSHGVRPQNLLSASPHHKPSTTPSLYASLPLCHMNCHSGAGNTYSHNS